MTRKKTNKEFLSEVRESTGDEYSFLERYDGANMKILCKHNECGLEFKVTPKHFLNSGSRCPECYKEVLRRKFKKTTEEFLEEAYALVGSEYTFYGEYYNARTKIKVRHESCGSEYEILPDSFLRGSRCTNKECRKRNNEAPHIGAVAKTNQDFIAEVAQLVGNEYTFLETYKKSGINIKVKHNLCGHKYSVQPNSFLSGARCNKCHMKSLHEKLRKTSDEFIKDVELLSGSEYTVLGKYANSNTKIAMKHNVCGAFFSMRPNSFINRGTRCPQCSESKGEREVRNVLLSLNVLHEPQYKISNCKNKAQLPFDFAVFNGNRKLVGLIEYDGIQHYKPVKHFGGEKSFLVTQNHDSIKSRYCLDNDIPLLRIPYYELNNMEALLVNFLNSKEVQLIGGVKDE